MHTRWDVDLSFEVGTAERHDVVFRWRQWWGDATIDVDGVQVLREKHPFGMRKVRRYERSVGVSEVHAVMVEMRSPRPYAGTRQHSFSVFVDGILVEEH